MEDFDQLVKKASNGDVKAFEQICIFKGEDIVYLCIKSMENVQDGEDAAQEVFIRLQKGIGSLKHSAAFNRWLYLLVQNTCNDLRRKNMKSKNDSSIDTYVDILEEKTEYLPQDIIENEEKRLQLQQVINKMSYSMRMAVILFYYEGLTREEIAEVLSLPLNTIKVNLYRARIKIRKEIEILEPDYKRSASIMPMVCIKVLFQKDAKTLVNQAVVQKCFTPAVQAAALAVTGVTATSIANIVTTAISVGLVSVCITATIVSANNNFSSGPSFINASDSAPQRIEQAEQSMVEDRFSSESTLVISPSQPWNSDSVAVGEMQDGENETNQSANGTEIYQAGEEYKNYNLEGKVFLLDKSEKPIDIEQIYTPHIRVAITANNKIIAQTKINSQGIYSFSSVPLQKGEYQIKAFLSTEKNTDIFQKNGKGKVSVIVGGESNIVVSDMYIIDDAEPSAAVLLYDGNQKVTSTNPKEVRVYIGSVVRPDYSLEVYFNDAVLVCQGDKDVVDEFLQSDLEPGRYTVKLIVFGVDENKVMDQSDFRII